MRIDRIAGCLALLLSGCAAPGPKTSSAPGSPPASPAASPPGQGCTLGLVTEAPLRVERGLFFTELTINGHAAKMMVDSGSFLSVLSPDAAARYGVKTGAVSTYGASGIGGSRLAGTPGTSLGYVRTRGIGGDRTAGIVASDQVSFGRLKDKSMVLLTEEWNPPRTEPPTDGLIGADFLSQFDVDYDAPGGRIAIYKALGRCQDPPVALDGDLFEAAMVQPRPDEHRALLKAVVDGREMTALLDTGAQVSALFRDAASRLKIDFEAQAAKGAAGQMSGIGPDKVRAARYVAALTKLGDLEIRNLPLAIADQDAGDDRIDMLLGQDFLRNVHVWISNSRRRAIFQAPPRPSPRAGG